MTIKKTTTVAELIDFLKRQQILLSEEDLGGENLDDLCLILRPTGEILLTFRPRTPHPQGVLKNSVNLDPVFHETQ